MGNYLEASAVVEFVAPSGASNAVSDRLARYCPLIVLHMCHVAAVRLFDERFRRSRSPSHWPEFGSAVSRLNDELRRGTQLILGSSLLRDSRQLRDEAEDLATTYGLEIVDALQLQHLKRTLDVDPLGILVTCSDAFEQAAAREGLKVWHCIRDQEPA